MGWAAPARLGHGPEPGEVERAQSAQSIPALGRVYGGGELGRVGDLALAPGLPRRCWRAISASNTRMCRPGERSAMAKVEMYSTMWCPYCARARALLERKGVEFIEIDLMEEPRRRDEMIRRA